MTPLLSPGVVIESSASAEMRADGDWAATDKVEDHSADVASCS